MNILEALESSNFIRHEKVYDGMWFDLSKLKHPVIQYKYIVSNAWEAKVEIKKSPKRKKKTKSDYLKSKK